MSMVPFDGGGDSSVIKATLSLDKSRFSAGLRGAGAEAARFGNVVQRVSSISLTNLRRISATATATGLSISFLLKRSVDAAIPFERAMRNVNSIMGMSESQFRKVSAQVVELSTRVPQSATVLGEGLYDIGSSGFNAAEGMMILESAAISASAGMTTTAVSAQAIAAVLNAYGEEASQAADVSDVLFETVNLGVVSFEELATTVGDWVGMAAAAGVEFDQAAAAMAAMTLAGVQAAEASTSLGRLMQSFIEPSEALSDALLDAGYSSGLLALQQEGLAGVMEIVRQSTRGNVEELVKYFPEIRAARGALALMAAEGENFSRVNEGITDRMERLGAAQKAYNEQSKSTAFQMEILRNNIEAFGIEFGQAMLPAINIVVRFATGFVKAVDAVLDFIPGIRTVIASVAAATAVFLTFGGALLFTIVQHRVLNYLLTGLAARSTTAMIAVNALKYSMQALTVASAGIGLLITGASLATMLFGDRSQAASERVQKLRDALDETGTTVEGINEAVSSTVEMNFVEEGLIDDLDRLGLTTDDVTRAVRGSAGAYESLQDRMEAARIAAEDLALAADPEHVYSSDELRDTVNAIEAVSDATDNWRDALSGMANEQGDAAVATEDLTRNQVDQIYQQNRLNDGTYDYVGILHDLNARIEAGTYASAQYERQLSFLENALGVGGEAAEEWAKENKDFIDSVGEFVNPAGAYKDTLSAMNDQARAWAETVADKTEDAEDSWEDYFHEVTEVGFPAFQQALFEQMIAQEQWFNNLNNLAARGFTGIVTYAQEQGPEFASALNEMVAMSDRELSQLEPVMAGQTQEAIAGAAAVAENELAVLQVVYNEFGEGMAIEIASGLRDGLFTIDQVMDELGITFTAGNAVLTEDARETSEELKDNARSMMRSIRSEIETGGRRNRGAMETAWRIAKIVARDGSAATAQAIATQLGIGVDRVEELVDQYGITISGGLNPILSGLGQPELNYRGRHARQMRNLEGGIAPSAEGNLFERHDPQIAPAGAWRVWAEPETGGEAYIPLRNDHRRGRAISILEQVAEKFGMRLERYATGGFWGPEMVPRPPDFPPHEFYRPAEAATKHLYDKVVQWVRENAIAQIAANADGLQPFFLARWNAYNAASGNKFSITSGWRSSAQQAVLYARYLAGVPGQAPAAPPGRSNHERGLAIDHSPHSTSSDRARAAGFRLKYPMSYEPWHVEPVEAAKGAILYDQGGLLQPGVTTVLNNTGRPEPVFNAKDFERLIESAAQVHLHLNGEPTAWQIKQMQKAAAKVVPKVLAGSGESRTRMGRL